MRIKLLITRFDLRDMRSNATNDVLENLIKTIRLEILLDSIKNIVLLWEENISKWAIMVEKFSDMNLKPDILYHERLVHHLQKRI